MDVYLMCGVVGSGKTTRAKQLSEETGGVIINRDNIRTMLFGEYGYNPEREDLVKDIAYSCMGRILDHDLDVIIDETNITEGKRGKWTSLLTATSRWFLVENMICVYCSSQKGNLERRMRESRGYTEEKWRDVIERMKRDFEPPRLEEGFDRIEEYRIS